MPFSPFPSYARFLRAGFLRDRRGIVAVVFAFSGVAIVTFASLIVTYWQQINDRNELQAVADQAALAASAYLRSNVAPGSPVSDGDRAQAKNEAERVVLANNLDYRTLSIDYVNIGGEPFYDVRITAARDSFFNVLFGQDRRVEVFARVNINLDTGAEIALVLDVSGSMQGSPTGSPSRKIDLMTEAAKDLIDIVLLSDRNNPNSPRNPNIYFSVVPYATAVRLPSDLSSRWISESTRGAVSDPAFAWSSLNSPPSWTRDGYSYASSRESPADRRTHYGHCPGYRRAPHRESDASPTSQPLPVYPGSRILYHNTLQSSYIPDIICGGEENAVTPLTDDRTRLFAAISALEPIGATATHQGMLWGWRSISPNWRWSLNSQTTHDPIPYGNERNRKYIILLTDGVIFNGSPSLPEIGPPYDAQEAFVRNPPRRDPSSVYYPIIPSNELISADPLDYIESYDVDAAGDLSNPSQISRISNLPGSYGMLQRVCSAVKQSSRNVEVFTIVYDLRDPLTQRHFRDCASDGGGNYFEATTDNLDEVFAQIAEQIRGKLISLQQ